ncbi:MAG TPA: DUF5668 domain-containing protein [Bacteroidales bacterium]|nr:DUF5668 domain-containing protein [Bacteroidales bacterium]
MSYRKIFWGVVLVLIGILFILKNTGAIYFNWHTVWNLWPVLLILWGIAMIPVKDWIKVTLSIATVIITFFAVQQYGDNSKWNWHFKWDEDDEVVKIDRDDDESDALMNVTQTLTEDYDSTFPFAKLNLNIGVGQFEIRDTTSKLLVLDRSGSQGTYSMTTSEGDSTKTIDVSLNKAEFKGEIKNEVRMRLNPNPVWDLGLNIGAAEVDFDLSGFKTRNILIEGGASDIEVKIGKLLPESFVNIKAGAASITVKIPKEAGAQITNNTFMASKSFDGFKKIDSHLYQTPDFNTNPNKIKINMEAGMARIDVVRY